MRPASVGEGVRLQGRKPCFGQGVQGTPAGANSAHLHAHTYMQARTHTRQARCPPRNAGPAHKKGFITGPFLQGPVRGI